LALATDLASNKVVIASDCKTVIDDIKNSKGAANGY
jgi:hypothetical protein